MMLNGVERLHM